MVALTRSYVISSNNQLKSDAIIGMIDIVCQRSVCQGRLLGKIAACTDGKGPGAMPGIIDSSQTSSSWGKEAGKGDRMGESGLSKAVSSQAHQASFVVLGWIVGADPDRGILVNHSEHRGEPLVAQSLMSWTEEGLRDAIARRQPAALLFEQGDARRPVLVGLVQTIPEVFGGRDADALRDGGASDFPEEVEVDGRRLVLSGKEEVVIRCGKASITLRANGRVQIKGDYVLSHSQGVNRIRGGSVQIN